VFSHYCDAIFPVYLVRATAKPGEFLGSPPLTAVLTSGSGLGADPSCFAGECCAEDGKFAEYNRRHAD